MFGLLAKIPEYVACAAVMIAAVGYAWLTIELSGEAAITSDDGSKDEPRLW